MTYTAPNTVAAGETYSAASHNVIVNDVIDHEARLLAQAAQIKYIATVTQTSSYTITATSVGAAADVFSSDLTFTAVSGKLYRFEISSSAVLASSANNSYGIHLVNGAGTALTQIALFRNAGAAQWAPLCSVFLYEAGSGSVSFNLRATKEGGNDGSFDAGTGSSGTVIPIRMTVYGPLD